MLVSSARDLLDYNKKFLIYLC